MIRHHDSQPSPAGPLRDGEGGQVVGALTPLRIHVLHVYFCLSFAWPLGSPNKSVLITKSFIKFKTPAAVQARRSKLAPSEHLGRPVNSSLISSSSVQVCATPPRCVDFSSWPNCSKNSWQLFCVVVFWSRADELLKEYALAFKLCLS